MSNKFSGVGVGVALVGFWALVMAFSSGERVGYANAAKDAKLVAQVNVSSPRVTQTSGELWLWDEASKTSVKISRESLAAMVRASNR